MDFNEDAIYFSDDDYSDELFWSDPDGKDSDCRPLCIGCQCKQTTCESESLMPLIGSVEWNVGCPRLYRAKCQVANHWSEIILPML